MVHPRALLSSRIPECQKTEKVHFITRRFANIHFYKRTILHSHIKIIIGSPSTSIVGHESPSRFARHLIFGIAEPILSELVRVVAPSHILPTVSVYDLLGSRLCSAMSSIYLRFLSHVYPIATWVFKWFLWYPCFPWYIVPSYALAIRCQALFFPVNVSDFSKSKSNPPKVDLRHHFEVTRSKPNPISKILKKYLAPKEPSSWLLRFTKSYKIINLNSSEHFFSKTLSGIRILMWSD